MTLSEYIIQLEDRIQTMTLQSSALKSTKGICTEYVLLLKKTETLQEVLDSLKTVEQPMNKSKKKS